MVEGGTKNWRTQVPSMTVQLWPVEQHQIVQQQIQIRQPNAMTSKKGEDTDNLYSNAEYTEYNAEDQTPYCFCRKPDNGSFMIYCEFCSEWYHGSCVGILERYKLFFVDFRISVMIVSFS